MIHEETYQISSSGFYSSIRLTESQGWLFTDIYTTGIPSVEVIDVVLSEREFNNEYQFEFDLIDNDNGINSGVMEHGSSH
ncbi:hypothetical protein DAMA08_044590 [Martiniozyma asiatica (nom. inval.)]|nr:hypothetical protein DAMA08_044590 [Martiniozyma asiatica]